MILQQCQGYKICQNWTQGFSNLIKDLRIDYKFLFSKKVHKKSKFDVTTN